MKIAAVIIGVAVLTVAGVFFFMRGGNGDGAGGPFKGPLRVGMECDYAPYNWQENKATDTNIPLANRFNKYAEGYDVQIAKAIAERMGVKLEINKVLWESLIPALNDGQIDVIISGMADTPARLEMPVFTASKTYNVNVAEYCLMVRADSLYTEAFSLADFYGARVMGQRGTNFDAVIDQIPGVKHLQPVETLSQMMASLIGKNADAVVVDLESAEAYTKTYPGTAFVRFRSNEGFRLSFTGICVWTRRADKGLLKAVNDALSQIPTEKRQELMDLMRAKAAKL